MGRAAKEYQPQGTSEMAILTQAKYVKRKSGVNGWFAVSRNIFEHHLVGAGNEDGVYTRMEAFLWIVANAAWEPTKGFDGVNEVDLQPGELACSQRFLAEAWGWSRSAVRVFLDALTTAHTIVQSRPHNAQSSHRISLVNWEKYQVWDRVERWDRPHSAQPAPTEQPTLRPKIRTNNNTSPDGEDRTPDLDCLEAFTLYNSLALQLGLPQASTLTPSRRQLLKARLKEHGGLDGWRRALENLKASAFLRGENDRAFRASLDFILQASSFAKLIDGAYADARKKGPQPLGSVGTGIRNTDESFADYRARMLAEGKLKPPPEETP
jgi:hypothetical protein